jgi:hypothetical protein
MINLIPRPTTTANGLLNDSASNDAGTEAYECSWWTAYCESGDTTDDSYEEARPRNFTHWCDVELDNG